MAIVVTEASTVIQIVLGGVVSSNELDWAATYRDFGPPSPEGRFTTAYGVTNGVTAVPVVSAIDPPNVIRRELVELHIFNADTTQKDVHVQLDNNGTVYKLHAETGMQSTKELQYIEGKGFFAL